MTDKLAVIHSFIKKIYENIFTMIMIAIPLYTKIQI